MNEKTMNDIRRIAEEQFPGCYVEFSESGNQLLIRRDGEIMQSKAPTHGMQINLSDDEAVRRFLKYAFPEKK